MQEVSSSKRLEAAEKVTEPQNIYGDSCRPENNSLQPRNTSLERGNVKPHIKDSEITRKTPEDKSNYSDSNRIRISSLQPRSTVLEKSDVRDFAYTASERPENKSCEPKNDCYKHCPVENGKWEGKPGNSVWHPDGGYVPMQSNPEEKTWSSILSEYKIKGISFKDGSPDFNEISKATVKIEGFTINRVNNFAKADMALSEKRNCTPDEVRQWRKDNNYTWHECTDMETMQLVPSIIHGNIPHVGGISILKNNEKRT